MVTKSRPRKHFISSNPAPLGGLNVRDAINAMPPTDALDLLNWIPQQYGIKTRKGWRRFAIGLDAPVRSVMQYQPNREASAATRIFAATDSGIFNVTSGPDTPSSVVTLPGTVNYGSFSDTMFTNVAGSFLITCSHEGGYRTYDGTNWVTRVAGAGTGEINGVDPDLFCFTMAWKRRLWFVEKDSTKVWYLPTDSIAGVAEMLDLGPFMAHGGKIAFIANWTIDAGEGIDDFLIIAGENGDVLIYKGTNPASAATFALVGVYQVGALPIGRRGFTAYGGDLLLLSERGIQPMSYVTRGGQSFLRASSIDYLGKIQPRIAELIGNSLLQRGWSMIQNPRENLIIISTPSGVTGIFDQYALYTNTNSWTLLRGMPNNGSMCVANSQMYFGTEEGEVILAFEGVYDNVAHGATSGDGITGLIQPAYSYFNMPGMNKKYLMVRPTFLAQAPPAFVVQIAVDFSNPTPLVPGATTAPPGPAWDISLWDNTDWDGGLDTFDEWKGVGAIGYAGSVIMRTVTAGDTFLASLDYMYEPGGVL